MKKMLLLFLFAACRIAAQSMAPSEISLAKPEQDRLYRTPEVDVKPELEKGMYTLSMFISKNFKMPHIHNKKVKLFVGFVIETNGNMTDARFIYMTATAIDEKLSAALSEQQKKEEAAELELMKAESVRVLKQFKGVWKPAMKDGKAVRCQYNYPVNFTLE